MVNDWIDRTHALVGRMPAQAWAAAVACLFVVALFSLPLALQAMRRRGERLAHPDLVQQRHERRRDRVLFVAAIIPAVLFWGMVMAVSFTGLYHFGQQQAGLQGNLALIVPGTLDGVSVTFGVLAFRAVRKTKSPDRCKALVVGAASFSALFNFIQEYLGGSFWGGVYLAFTSIVGVVIFHEFLDQFSDGAEFVVRSKPRFGMRWVTYPWPTLCAWLAWTNHEPRLPEGRSATVRDAVRNLERVRRAKRVVKAARAVARHQRTLADAGRKAEVQAVTTAAPAATNPVAPPPSTTAAVSAPSAAPSAPRIHVPARHPSVVLPQTVAKCAEWLTLWAAICTHDRVFAENRGGLPDATARARYQCGGRKTRAIRSAARSGLLREKAMELGVPLPSEYVDRPEQASTVSGRPTLTRVS